MNPSLLQIGSTGLEVVTAQKLLTEAGFSIEADGVFGSETDKATRKFQKSKGLDVDGKIGNDTWAALTKPEPDTGPKKVASIAKPNPEPLPVVKSDKEPSNEVDARSEKTIKSLLPQIQERARQLVRNAAAKGIEIKIISGLRTYDEQDALFAKGRTSPGSKVTNAQGGQSWHNHGCAFDFGVFEDGKYIEDGPQYKAVGKLGKELGFEWGGDWKTINDEPHFQDANGQTIAQAKALHKKGKTVFDA